MTPDGRDRALVRYLDGVSTPEETAELATLLRQDGEARALLRAMTTQAVLIGDQVRARGTARVAPLRVERTWWRRPALLAAAAVLVVVLAGVLAWPTAAIPGRIVVTQISGSVTLTTAEGRHAVSVDLRFHHGLVEVEGETAAVHLRLDDGSLLMLNGPSQLTLPASTRDAVTLTRGSLTAEVAPQRPGQPLTIRTPTAEVAVLGTVLRVDAAEAETMLVVDEGHVRLKRLVDAATVEVARGQMATATLEQHTQLAVRTVTAVAAQWQADFSAKPGKGWHGTWLPADATVPARMKAALDLSYRKPDGTPVPAHTISVRSGPGLATIASDSVLRVRLRQQRDEDVLVLVSLRRPGGQFAGNFQTKIPVRTLAKDAQGWRTWEIPLASLQNGWPAGSTMLVGNRIGLLYLACHQAGSALEVSELVIGK